MPEPVTSSSFTPNLTCNLDDDPPLACQTEPVVSPPPASTVCGPPAASAGPSSGAGVSTLVQKFSASDQPAFVPAAPPASSAAGAPPVLTVRPDRGAQ